MISLRDAASMREALTRPLAPALHALLADRIAKLSSGEFDLTGMTHLVVIDAQTTEAALIAETGLSPLQHPSDAPVGEDGWPWWDYLALHEESGFYDILICVGDSGYAIHLLISPECTIPGLLDLCREFSN